MVKIDTLLAEIDKLKEEFTAALKDVEQKRSQFIIE
jgi:F0F1-type ATP synthase membrane subunit b/b'